MLSIDITIPIIVGSILGFIFSYLFKSYVSISKPYSGTIFGINTNTLITSSFLFMVILSIGGLAGMSAIIKDIEYIQTDTFKFIIETLLMAIVPTIAFLIVIYLRKNKITWLNNIELIFLAFKFAALHVLLQISGYYRYLFSN